MTLGDVALLIAAGGGLTGLAALIRVWYDRRRGIASDERLARVEEREDRRDVRTDLNDLIDRLLVEVQDLRQRQAEDRKRIESLEQSRRDLEDYADALEHHIWQQLPPPPPPRPGSA